MGAAYLQARKAIERAFENQVGEKDGRFQRIADDVSQAALSLQPRVLRGARCGLRVHEQHDAELFRFCPERIELAVGELLPFDTAPYGGATHSQLSDGVIQLIGRQIGVLHRKGCHPHKAIRVRGTPF